MEQELELLRKENALLKQKLTVLSPSSVKEASAAGNRECGVHGSG